MNSLFLSMSLSAFLALGLANAFAQDNEGPAKTSIGTFNSDKLIQFEDNLDFLERNFTSALTKGGDLDYESLLSEFEERGSSLQKEAVKAGLLDFVDVRNDVNTICDTYNYMKAALAKGERMPLVKLISTRRRNRAEGQGPAENWAEFKCTASLEAYYEPYAKMDSQGFSKVAPYDLIEAIANLRQMIGWMERSGKWNTLANNGRTFVLNSVPDTEFETMTHDEPAESKPKKVAVEAQAKQRKIKF